MTLQKILLRSTLSVLLLFRPEAFSDFLLQLCAVKLIDDYIILISVFFVIPRNIKWAYKTIIWKCRIYICGNSKKLFIIAILHILFYI